MDVSYLSCQANYATINFYSLGLSSFNSAHCLIILGITEHISALRGFIVIDKPDQEECLGIIGQHI